MDIRCVWEHNGSDTLLYSINLPGAYARGSTREEALRKMPQEAAAYLRWTGQSCHSPFEIQIVQEKPSQLVIADADSDVLFDSETLPLSAEEYQSLKALVLKSAEDFERLYQSIPNKDESCLAPRKTFYGNVPRTANEMYVHTRSVNSYYFGEIDVEADNDGTILECRRRGFAALEQRPDFLKNPVVEGSYGEAWSLRKVLRRFLWHDRIHAKAMYRMAVKTFGADQISDTFQFNP